MLKQNKRDILHLTHILALYVCLLGLAACAGVNTKNTQPIYWPAPPAIPRLVYETTLKSQQDFQERSYVDRLRQAVSGSAAESHSFFIKPYDVAAFGGLIAVSDTRTNLVHVFDVSRKRIFVIGGRGTGRLVQPLGVAIDEQKRIYVADSGLRKIVVFDQLGHFIRFIGESSDFARLSDVAVSSDGVLVYGIDRGGVDSTSHQVIIFNIQDKNKSIVGKRGAKLGEFNHPTQAAVDSSGNLYVLDSGNFRVQVFSSTGVFLRAWGRPGKNFGNFARPRGIAVNRQGYVFVTDAAFQNFQIFNGHGQLLLPVGEAGDDRPGHYMLPAGIAVDETERIYVVDQLYGKIEVMRLLSEQESQAIKR